MEETVPADPTTPTTEESRRQPTLRDRLHASWLPLALLAVMSMVSLGVRAAWLDQPCAHTCASVADRTLIFDEVYYVNAARVIAGVPVSDQSHYGNAPPGLDPNSEHPQLGKLIIAASIKVLGDGPLAWRLGSLIFGTVAIWGLFALVQTAGGTRWLALGTATLMAADNLFVVHGRIGTLDIYVLAFMLWAAACYLRGWRVAAGVVLGIGACVKLVAPYLLIVLALFELGQLLQGSGALTAGANWGRRMIPPIRRLATCAAVGGAVYLVLLGVLDHFVVPYDPGTGRPITGGPIAHTLHMFSYAAGLTSPYGPVGIASYPWQWLGDWKPIVYLNIDVTHPGGGLFSTVHFLGVINPVILVFALPGLALAAVAWWRRGEAIDALGITWLVGTLVPFVFFSALLSRTSYLYYMVVVMPGIYILVARLFARRWMLKRVTPIWAALVLAGAVLLYPFLTLPDPNWVT